MALAEVVETLDVLVRSYRRQRAAVDEAVRFRQRLADAISSKTPLLSESLKKIDKRLNLTRNLERAHVGAPVRKSVDPKRYDLIHLTLPSSFKLIQHLESARHLTTLHDCTHRLFPEFHTRPNIDVSERGMEFSLKKDANFIAVSRSTRADLLEIYNIPPDRVTMIYEGSDPLTFYAVSDESRLNQLREKYGIPEGVPYFLTLSTLEPRKNLSNTLKAFSRLLRDMPDSACSPGHRRAIGVEIRPVPVRSGASPGKGYLYRLCSRRGSGRSLLWGSRLLIRFSLRRLRTACAGGDGLRGPGRLRQHRLAARNSRAGRPASQSQRY